MKIFPKNSYKFKIIGEDLETLERLNRRTEFSDNLISINTSKSFIGKINKNNFRIISSQVGFGAFCVLNGFIKDKNGEVSIEIHKVFRGFICLFLCFPIIGLIIQSVFKREFSLIFVLVALGQLILIRYFFIEFTYRRLSKSSLNRLADVLDFEDLKKIA